MRYFQLIVHTHQTFPSFLLHVTDRFAEAREKGIKASNGRSTQPKVRVSGLKLLPSFGFLKIIKLLCYIITANQAKFAP